MKAMRQKIDAVQNLGWIDRSLRMIIGWAIIAVAYADLSQGAMVGWHSYALVVSVYPILTALIGWDPLYSTKNLKSCDTSQHNQCGTFPFEIKSALGLQPSCRADSDCSLPEPRAHQRHNQNPF